jgi:hypothetical protein
VRVCVCACAWGGAPFEHINLMQVVFGADNVKWSGFALIPGVTVCSINFVSH